MQKDNFQVSVIAALMIVAGFGLSAHATSGDLEIKVDKNSDLTREPTVSSLQMETHLTEEKERHADQVAISASFLNLGHPAIVTDQTSTYNMSSGEAVGFEYSHSFGTFHLTGTMGYDYLQRETSTAAPEATALHIVPIGLLAEYYYKRFEKFRPFIGAGVMSIIQSQRGIDEENLTELNTLPVLTLGMDYKTPWGFKLHARARELLPQANSASEFYGQIFDLGIVYSL